MDHKSLTILAFQSSILGEVATNNLYHNMDPKSVCSMFWGLCKQVHLNPSVVEVQKCKAQWKIQVFTKAQKHVFHSQENKHGRVPKLGVRNWLGFQEIPCRFLLWTHPGESERSLHTVFMHYHTFPYPYHIDRIRYDTIPNQNTHTPWLWPYFALHSYKLWLKILTLTSIRVNCSLKLCETAPVLESPFW